MTNYYALWIPSFQEEVPTIQRDKLDEVILRDIPGSDTIRLKGEIDKTSFNIHLSYQINKTAWNHLHFTCTDRQQTDGFIFYALEMKDHEVETDFVRNRLSENLPKSVYHYFKEFFHIHSLHATGEDSLLPVFHSQEPIDWSNNQIRKSVITPIIEAYTDKFNGFYQQGRDNLQQYTTSICQNREVTKNIHNLRNLLHDGYRVKREMDYCRFILNKHREVLDDELLTRIQKAYQSFQTYYTDLDFWYHAYLDTINFSDSKASKKWGITGGILGLLSIFITLFLEYKPSKPDAMREQLIKADSLIQVKQDNMSEKLNQLINSCKPDTIQPPRLQKK